MSAEANVVAARHMTDTLLRNFEDLVLFLRESPLEELIAESNLGAAYDEIKLLQDRLYDISSATSSPRSSRSSLDSDVASPSPHLQLRTTGDPALDNAQLSDFVSIRVVGTGTFGTVQLVKHTATRKEYACKVLDKHRIVATRQVAHLRSERDILLRVDHPFIVQVHKTFQDPQNIYFLMDYVSGGELFEYIRRAKRFTTEEARFFAAEVVEALAHLHSHRIMYRDLKPENVLLDETGHIKLIDFGFAKVLQSGERAFTMCGTPEYIAPEVVLSKGHDAGVDWWSLGVLLYEMLMGTPPFSHPERSNLFGLIVSGRVRYKRRIDPSARALIDALLVVDPSQRLGNTHGGVQSIRSHEFFQSVDWSLCSARRLQPPLHPVPTAYRFEALPPMQLPAGTTVNIAECFEGF